MTARTSNSSNVARRPCLFVFESNLRVLNYIKRTFSSLYDLHLFSEEKAFLRDLEKTERPSLVLLAWDGIEHFLEPGREILVASDGVEVADLLNSLNAERAHAVAQRARRRILAHHTYHHRAGQFQNLLARLSTRTEAAE